MAFPYDNGAQWHPQSSGYGQAGDPREVSRCHRCGEYGHIARYCQISPTAKDAHQAQSAAPWPPVGVNHFREEITYSRQYTSLQPQDQHSQAHPSSYQQYNAQSQYAQAAPSSHHPSTPQKYYSNTHYGEAQSPLQHSPPHMSSPHNSPPPYSPPHLTPMSSMSSSEDRALQAPYPITKYKQRLERCVEENDLRKFSASKPDYLEYLAQEADSRVNYISRHWNLPKAVAMDFILLSLYDVVLFIDDSGSMAFDEGGKRKDELVEILRKVVYATTLFNPSGISVRFMNSNIPEDILNNVSNVNQILAIVDKVFFTGATPLGRELKNKVIDRYVRDLKEAAQSNGLKKPTLVIVVTDGEPDGDVPNNRAVFGTIKDAVSEAHRLSGSQGAIAFQFAQIGNDVKARQFLHDLDDDPTVGKYVDCTSNFDREFEEMRDLNSPVALTYDRWLAKLLLGGIIRSYDLQDEMNIDPPNTLANQEEGDIDWDEETITEESAADGANLITGTSRPVRGMSMEAGRHGLRTLAASNTFHASPNEDKPREIKVNWEMLQFLDTEFSADHPIDNIMILVEDKNQQAWCGTCADYLHWKWSRYAAIILELIRNSLKDSAGIARYEARTKRSDLGEIRLSLNRPGTATPSRSPAKFFLKGSDDAFKQITEAIVFLASVLRPNPNENLFNSVPAVHKPTGAGVTILLQPLKERPSSSKSCWNVLFPNNVIAIGFPIPARDNSMKGLEIPFSLMLELAGAEMPIEEGEGLVIAGFSTVLFPIITASDGAQLQWHLEYTDDLKAGAPFAKFSGARHFMAKSFEELSEPKSRRHFLGWCQRAVITLGSAGSDFSLVPTSADEDEEETKKTTENITAQLAFHGVGLTGGRTYERGSSRRSPYEDKKQAFNVRMEQASEAQILLVSPGSHRCWLVPKTYVLLHMIISYMKRLSVADWSQSHDENEYPYAEISRDCSDTALRTLIFHQEQKLRIEDQGRPILLREQVVVFCHTLDKFRRDSQFSTDRIHGFEFSECVWQVLGYGRVKKMALPQDRLGGWLRLAKDVNVLFFETRTDPILSADPDRNNLCGWKQLPPDENYLAVTCATLRKFCRNNGGLRADGRLREKAFWHWRPNPFDRCQCWEGNHCNPWQTITATQSENPCMADLEAFPGGAIVFKQQETLKSLRDIVKAKNKVLVEHIRYPQGTHRQAHHAHTLHEPSFPGPSHHRLAHHEGGRLESHPIQPVPRRSSQA